MDSLRPTPGYCIFIDIASSTAMKQQGLRTWVALIHNCFANAHLFLDPFPPIKGIGDALMYYIELSDLKQSHYNPLKIFDSLWQVATDKDPGFPEVKIGAARCEEAYSLTFLRGNLDYYGVDIDVAARLLGLAKEREVIVERRFYEDIAADYQSTGNREQFVSFRSLQGPKEETLKGIPNPVEVYRTHGM